MKFNPRNMTREAAAKRRQLGIGGPQLTLTELADEAGVSRHRVAGMWWRDKTAPRPTYPARLTPNGTIYVAARFDAAKLRAWWRSRLEAQPRAA